MMRLRLRFRLVQQAIALPDDTRYLSGMFQSRPVRRWPVYETGVGPTMLGE